MTLAVVNVATTDFYRRGAQRMRLKLAEVDPDAFYGVMYRKVLGEGWPTHEDKPYAFKAYALKEAANQHFDLLLWCDSCIVPVRSMEPLWKRIEKDGYWFAANGFTNYEWTADSAYPDLFPEIWTRRESSTEVVWNEMRAMNRDIPHVVATAFGLNVRHPKGKAFLDEYYRLASETRAFCGPWINATHIGSDTNNARCSPCGPPDVAGHRHDQTCASVIAWRLGFELTKPPEIFAYGKLGDPVDERTILIADGAY